MLHDDNRTPVQWTKTTARARTNFEDGGVTSPAMATSDYTVYT